MPFAPFLRSMGTAIYPKHILEEYVNNNTFYYVENDISHSVWDIDTDPAEIIGTGPFTISEYTPLTPTTPDGSGFIDGRLVLKSNPNYWLKDEEGNTLPYLDEIIYVIVEDLDVELEKFKAGESDSLGVTGEEFAKLEPLQEEQNFTIHKQGPGFGTTFLGFNVNPGQSSKTEKRYVAPEKLEWFSNKNFRQAVAYSIDKDNDYQRSAA